MQPDRLIKAWYVLHTKSRFENVVSEGLLKKSLECFLPKVLVRSKRRDRRLMIRVPLFPGYVFVKTDLNPAQHLEILKTVGAVKLVGNSSGPIPVPQETVESLKIMVATDSPVTTGYAFKPGDRVMVINGPLEGVVGIFERYGNKGRVVVHIEALGQFAAVEVDLDDVTKLPPIKT